MEALIEVWNEKRISVTTEDGFSYLSSKSCINRFETFKGTKEEIFKRFEKENNRLKYCNGSFYKFVNNKLYKEFRNWYDSLSKSKQFDMYYGNGVVD